MDRMGLGYDVIAARHPRSIYVSVSGFGNTDGVAVPRLARVRVDRRGDVGHLRLQERPGRTAGHDPGRRARRHQLRPVRGRSAILAALRHRDRTGEGQYVDIAMLDAMVAMTDVVTNFWSLGVRPDPARRSR